jgi:hypothetical protein
MFLTQLSRTAPATVQSTNAFILLYINIHCLRTFLSSLQSLHRLRHIHSQFQTVFILCTQNMFVMLSVALITKWDLYHIYRRLTMTSNIMILSYTLGMGLNIVNKIMGMFPCWSSKRKTSKKFPMQNLGNCCSFQGWFTTLIFILLCRMV